MTRLSWFQRFSHILVKIVPAIILMQLPQAKNQLTEYIMYAVEIRFGQFRDATGFQSKHSAQLTVSQKTPHYR